MSLKTRLITLTALGLLVLVAFSGVLPAAHAQSSPSVAVSLSDASVEQGTAITATMSFRGLAFDSDTSTTDYTFRADVTGANDCEGGGLGRTRYMYRVDQDPEVRTGTISASCPAGDYTIRATISTPLSVALAAATASFTVAAPAQEPTASPTASIALSPSDAVGEGAEITATMSFGGLASDSDASTTDYVFRADVVDADDCEGGGIGFDRYMYRVDDDPETRTGTISADCPAGAYTLRVSISSADDTELASATAGFFILGAPVLIEPPTLTALSVSHGDPAVDVTLSPAFASGTLAYRAAVRVAQVTVAPTAGDADATVAYLDGNDDAIADADAGADGHQVNLDAGSNTVKVAVSKGGLTTTYAVSLFRLVTQQQTADVTLVSNTGKAAGGTKLSASSLPKLAQAFTTGSNSGGYNLTSVAALLTENLASSDVAVTIREDSSGSPSDTALHTLVHPATAPTAHGLYTFTAPANTVLAASTTYFVHIERVGTTNISVTFTRDSGEDSGGADGWSIADTYRQHRTSWVTNPSGALQIQVTGSAVSGTQPPQSSDATLSALSLANAADDAAIALTPTFVSGTESYTADVLYSVVSTTVTATPTHASATEVIKLGGTEDADATVNLALGDNVITVEVTAQDGTTKTYTVTVTRAQTALSGTALVSNIGQNTSSAGLLGSSEWGQSFTTGSNADGYNLSSVELVIARLPTQTLTSSDLTVAIWSATNANPPLPDSALHTLGSPGSFAIGIASFSASSVTLDPTTTYFVHLSNTSGQNVSVDRTVSVAEDSGGAQGWSIGNARYYRNRGTNDAFQNSNNVLKMAVKGSVVSGTTNNEATGEPTISGTNLVGQAQTANKGSIADADGLPLESTFTYQWIRVSSGSEDDISGATSKTYTTVSADQGKKLKVTVGFTDNASNAESRTSSRSEIIGATTCTPTAPAAAIWSACLTVDVGGYYFEDTGVPDNYGALSNPEFTVDGTTYTFDTLQTFTTSLFLIFTTAPGNAASDWVLHVGSASTSFAFSAATLSDAGKQYRWSNAGLTWSGGDVISVWIAVAAAQSSDATLSELTLVNAADDAAITLTPPFVSATEGYRASVVSGVAKVTVTATTNHASATAVITPTDADSGTNGHQVNLTPGGDTVITVVVTSEDGTNKTYTVRVFRAAAGGLTSLSVSPGTLSPPFDREQRSYRVEVGNAVTQVTITTEGPAGVQVQFTKVNVVLADADAVAEGHQVDLAVGDNVISVIAVGPGSVISTYVVTVARAASDDATLRALTVTDNNDVPLTLTPTFGRATTEYAVSAANSIVGISLGALKNHSGATVRWLSGSDAVLATATAINVNSLPEGVSVYKAQVTAQDGNTVETYTVTVTKAAAGASVVTLNLDPATIDEDSGTAVNVTATVSPARTTEFTVTVTAAPPAADGAYTLSANTTLTFTANATESTGTVTITPVNNTDNERDKVITVSGAVAAGVTGVTGPADVTLTIEDDDHPVVNHTLTLHRNNAAKTLLDPTMIPEDVGQVCIRVTATTEADLPPETDDRPTGSSRSDTAVSPGDFSAVSGQFYLPRSAYSLESGHHVAVRDDCAALRIVDDSVDEGNEQFALYTQQSPLTPQTYEYEFTPSNPLTVTIIDNDEANLSIADAGGAEGEDLEFTVTLDPTSVREVTVDWAVNDDSATAGADYTDGSGTLTFAPGDTMKTVTVATLPDTAAEGAETFTVTLSNASNAAIGDAEATGTIAASEDVTVSTDATLKRLRLSHTNISDFDSDTTSYSVSLADSVVTVTPTANHPLAAITVNGAQVASGSDLEVDLALGANTVTIEVTAQDGIATKTYTVTVTRHECPGQEVAGEFVTDATGCPRLTLLDTGKVRVEWDAVTSGTTVTVRYYLNFVVTKVNPNGTKQKGKWFTKSDHYSGVTDSDASLTGETFSNLPLEANVVYFSYQTDGSAWSPWSMIWIDPQ